jgi:hypothetical protein
LPPEQEPRQDAKVRVLLTVVEVVEEQEAGIRW